MMDEEKNNSRDIVRNKQVDDEYLPSDAKPLCPQCLQPCDPLQYYCTNCNSNEAINPLSAYMPYVRLRFNIGIFVKLYRRACDSKNNPLLLRIIYWMIIIAWVMCFPH